MCLTSSVDLSFFPPALEAHHVSEIVVCRGIVFLQRGQRKAPCRNSSPSPWALPLLSNSRRRESPGQVLDRRRNSQRRSGWSGERTRQTLPRARQDTSTWEARQVASATGQFRSHGPLPCTAERVGCMAAPNQRCPRLLASAPPPPRLTPPPPPAYLRLASSAGGPQWAGRPQNLVCGVCCGRVVACLRWLLASGRREDGWCKGV